MDFLLAPFRVAYKVYFLLSFIILLVLMFPLFYYFLHDQSRFPSAFKSMRIFAKLINFAAFVRIRVKGAENIPQNGPYIICPNHSSFIDIPCIYILFKNYFVFTGKKEIEKWPLFHIFYTSGMNILVDRESRSGAFRAFKRISEVIDSGMPLIIFPEGTISKTAPRLAAFKTGAFAIAIQKGVPILPVTFINNWKRLQRGDFFMGKASPGYSQVIIHKPVITSGCSKNDYAILETNVREIINEPLKREYPFCC